MLTKINLKDLTKKEIKDFLKQQKKAHLYRRIQFVQYKKEGSTHEEIAQRLNVCLRTITYWNTLFSTEGMAGLINVSCDRRTSKLCSVEEDIRKEVQTGRFPVAKACLEWLKEEKNLSVSISNLTWFLKKNGIVLQKNKASSRRNA